MESVNVRLQSQPHVKTLFYETKGDIKATCDLLESLKFEDKNTCGM